jgi:mitochondrial division protein 1
MGGEESTGQYNNAMRSISRTMRRPALQRSVFSFTQQAPSELIRARVAPTEIAHRAITYISDEQLSNIPDDENTYSLFQGFQASLPEAEIEHRKGHRRRASKQKLLGAGDLEEDGPPTLQSVKKKRNAVNHRLEMMGIRKNMCATEIREIDSKIANLHAMRQIVLERLANLEDEEGEVDKELQDLDNNIEDMQDDLDAQMEAASIAETQDRPVTPESTGEDPSFMSESIYQKLPSSSVTPSPKSRRRPKYTKRKSMPVLHEHLESGTNLKTIPAHTDIITALDFDQPFGTMVTAALDDTVRVWDLNLGRCMGFLEGHTASVRCLQVEDNIVATGSLDATIRLWDLSQARYEPHEHKSAYDDPSRADEEDEEAALGFGNEHEDEPPPPPPDAMADCPLTVLEAHIDEVTALHLRGDTLVSGSADKTLRQWDLVKGRCVQTLDVLWAAAQASATINTSPTATSEPQWRPSGRAADATADFVGALQVFDAALACGTADGMVRLWDLRSGQVHRSLVGHTGPVTCLQFDQTHLVTGSVDRSIRVSCYLLVSLLDITVLGY